MTGTSLHPSEVCERSVGVCILAALGWCCAPPLASTVRQTISVGDPCPTSPRSRRGCGLAQWRAAPGGARSPGRISTPPLVSPLAQVRQFLSVGPRPGRWCRLLTASPQLFITWTPHPKVPERPRPGRQVGWLHICSIFKLSWLHTFSPLAQELSSK